ncbi:MAG: hypothetical protein BIFFINMI_00556 [Phycisphaerae bacterium]|nr:hypothetical protein [Phycisphaerae bacterium]
MAEENNSAEQLDTEPALKRDPRTAKRFFERAAEVAATGSYDYAIDLYRDGLKFDPEDVEAGHKHLREVALRRKANGGKKPGLRDQANYRKARSPLDKLLASEYMLAKEPDNPRYAESVMSAALKLGAEKTALWFAKLLIELNRESGKPTVERTLAAADAMEAVRAFAEAANAVQFALHLKPNDQGLLTRLKNLSAEATMKRGRYDEEGGDFHKSMDNAKAQAELQEEQRLVQREDVIDRQIDKAREEYEAEPEVPGKIFSLVDLLQKRSREEEENEAIAVLDREWKRSSQYRYKERIGDIRMRQNRRKAQSALEDLKAAPGDPELRRRAQQISVQARAFEEQEFGERVTNYPTDMSLKFEYARRLFLNSKFDQAIPLLQQAEADPKNRFRAMSLLGQAFFNLKFFSEAADTFRRAISSMEVTGNDISKEMHYHLGRALEEMGSTKDALAAFSQVLQWDFNFRDVRDRIKALREKQEGGNGASPEQ